jgi:hypothetical protein
MPGAEVAKDHGRYALFGLLVAIVLIPAIIGSSQTIFNDGDVSWHIAAGQWVIDHRAIPHTDPFSFTWAGKPWVPMELLADVLFASAYRLAGYSGIAALVTAALMALHAIIFFNARRSRWPLVPIIAMDLVLIPMMRARPHLLAWPLTALWTWLLLRAREQQRAPPLWAALLMIVWANLHGSWVIGLVIAGAFGLEALVAASDRVAVVRQWGLFGLACVAAVFVNASGVAGVIYPLQLANLAMLPLINEWRPASLDSTPWFFAVLAATLVLIWFQRPRLPIVRWVLLGGLLTLSLLQMRHQPVLAIVAAMVLPEAFVKSGASTHIDRRLVRLSAGAAAAFIVIRAILPIHLLENAANPWRLIAAVPPQLRSQPVLNGYSMGGPLILSGIRPYIDGRSDMYGDAFVLDYARISDGDAAALAAAEQRWNIRWAILPDRNDKLIALLDRSPDWRRIAHDRVGVIYVRSLTTNNTYRTRPGSESSPSASLPPI